MLALCCTESLGGLVAAPHAVEAAVLGWLLSTACRRYESDMPSALGVADIFADVPSHM